MKITSFKDEYDFLSNFYLCHIVWIRKDWISAEHVFQAMKCIGKTDRGMIRNLSTPGKAKRMGRRIVLRDDWEDVKEGMMLRTLRKKFLQNKRLLKKLIGTGDAELIEGNNCHANFWGNCECLRCKDLHGFNKLGEILMQVRDELR